MKGKELFKDSTTSKKISHVQFSVCCAGMCADGVIVEIILFSVTCS